MTEEMKRLQKSLDSIRKVTDFEPKAAIILGSGLGGLTAHIEEVCSIPYSEIEGFPVSTVAGHDGKFIFGHLSGVPVVVMSGRVHFYEGYDMKDVVMPIRIMGLLGAEKVLLTNAAGGVNTDFEPGTLMMITDHISQFVKSPLIGANVEELGVRFPDMSHVYDPELQQLIREASEKTGVKIREGVYLQLTGPNYETPAEIRMCRTLGADAVGMSTVCEAIAARHMGMRICGISCITNMAAGILDQPLNHEEVQATADKVKTSFETLVKEIVRNF